MRGILDRIPWTSFAGISTSLPAKIIAFIPLVAWIVLANGKIVSWLNSVSNELGLSASFGLYPRFVILYFGLIAISIALVLYRFRCPRELKEHNNQSAYLAAHNSEEEHTINAVKDSLLSSPYAEQTKAIIRACSGRMGIEPEYSINKWPKFRDEVYSLNFKRLNLSEALSRSAIALLYGFAFVAVGYPSVETLVRIIALVATQGIAKQ